MATTPAPGDDFGLFGPESVAWRLHREPALLVGGLSALMVQALHPLAIAAVADHSDYKQDVWARYDRTTNYVLTTIFGTTKQALAAGARVRAVHAPIKGVDRVTGLPYEADDPVLLLWIHATLVEGFLGAYRRFVRSLGQGDADRYVAEMVRQAELVGLRPEQVPATERGNSEFIRSCRPTLQVTRASLEAVDTVLSPPLAAWKRPFWWVVGQAAVTLLPDYARELYGLTRRWSDGAIRRIVRPGALAVRRRRDPPPVLQHARERALAAGYRW
jgi:uncharacterized protein (DUF2236 family)